MSTYTLADRGVAGSPPPRVQLIPAPGSQVRAIALDTPWQTILEAFLNAAVDTANTRRAYQRVCSEGCEWLGIGSLAELNGAKLSAYRAQVLARVDLGPASMSLALYGLRSFLRWAGVLGAHGLNWELVQTSLRPPRVTVRNPFRVFSDADLARLWEEGNKRPVTRALLCLGLGAGLRVSEISALRVRDLYPDMEGGPAVFVSQGKGAKDRMVPMVPYHFEGVLEYLEATGRMLGSPGRVFVAEDQAARSRPNSQAMGTSALYAAFKGLMARAGLDPERRGPHVMRHQYAIAVLRHSNNVVAVQKLLGHSNLATTSRYLDHLNLGDLRAALPQRPEGLA